jgi:hypothetical protein
MNGATRPTRPCSIRGDFAVETAEPGPRFDSEDNAAVELALWFRPEELLAYERGSTAGCSPRGLIGPVHHRLTVGRDDTRDRPPRPRPSRGLHQWQ